MGAGYRLVIIRVRDGSVDGLRRAAITLERLMGVPERDAFIGLDRLSSDGLADTERIGVFGAGTGGFLTTAALAKDEARFRAAVSLGGIVDATTASSYPGMD